MSITDQLAKLLPSGDGWPKFPGSNLWKTLDLFAGAYQRVIDFADYGKRDSFPLTAQDSLDVWKSSVGVPDPAGPTLTTAQQRTQMTVRVGYIGNTSPQSLTAFAGRIGYTISIAKLSAPRAGIARASLSRSYAVYADHTWTVSVANSTLNYFRAGANRAGDPLSNPTEISWLEYELRRVAPSQTLIEYFPAP
jgi:uncharacterized protein YmfQ (DUF2313 family)